MERRTLILFIGLIFCINIVCADSSDYFTLKWEFSPGGGVVFLEIIDLEGDGESEIIVGSSKQMMGGAAGWINILDKDKNSVGQYFLPGHVTGMVVADIDGDGEKEIITSVFSRLHVVDKTGKKKWDMTPRYGYDITSISVDDIDGDDKKEILVGAGSGSLHNSLFAISSGRIIWSIPTMGEVRTITSDDLDDDGNKEILIGCYGRWGSYNTNAAMQVFNNSGAKRFTYATRRGVASIHVADIDSDGNKEILVGSYNEFYVLDKDGTELWQYSTGGLIRDIAVDDIDEDSKKEIILGSNDVYVLDSQGGLEWKNSAGPEVYELELMDLNKNGVNEIIAASSDGGYVIKKGGETLWEYEGNTIRAIATGDLESDGYIELAMGSGSKTVTLFQSETYAKEQEAYTNYKLAESSYNKGDYSDAMDYVQKAEDLYSQLENSAGVMNAQTLISRIEGDAKRIRDEETLADDYYDKSANAYLSGDYINASKYAQKAKYKYTYLKNSVAAEKCDELIENSLQYMRLEADSLLGNATRLFDKEDYIAALNPALKSRGYYAFREDAENTVKLEEFLAKTYCKLAEVQSTVGDFENASIFIQKSFYLYTCLNDRPPLGCDPVNARITDIAAFAQEAAETGYGNSSYAAELLIVESLIDRIKKEDTGNLLDRITKAIESNTHYILFTILVLIVFALIAGSIYFLRRRQGECSESKSGLTALEPSGKPDTLKKKTKSRAEAKETTKIRLSKIRKDKLRGHGLLIKETMNETSWEDEL